MEESGTVEEIKWFLSNKKPVMLYYSKIPIDPDSVDLEQMKKLKEFKASIRDKGIQDDYRSCDELQQKLGRHLTFLIREMNVGPVIDKRAVEAVKASAREDSEDVEPQAEAPKTSKAATEQSEDVWLEDYTPKAFIIRGNTISHKDELKEASGRWISCLDGSKAWMFSKRHVEEVAKILGVPPHPAGRIVLTDVWHFAHFKIFQSGKRPVSLRDTQMRFYPSPRWGTPCEQTMTRANDPGTGALLAASDKRAKWGLFRKHVGI